MVLYQITNWSTVYESHESRKLESLRYVYVPNKHDGLGFRRLVAQKNACELFAAWILLLQIASKGKKGQRGVLARDGIPLDSDECALMTGFPSDAFKRAFNFFSLPALGWLTATNVTESCEELPGLRGEIPSSPGSLPPPPGQPGINPGQPGNVPGNLPAGPQQREEKGREEKEENILATASAAALALTSEDLQKTPKEKKPRARNELLDSLATVDGSNPEQVTPSAWAGIAKHLADIKAVSPDVTPDEISRRAANYRQMHREWPLTPGSIAKHWGSLDNRSGSKQSAKPVAFYAEPNGWKAWLNQNKPDSNFAANGIFEAHNWTDLDKSTQGWLAAEIARENRNQ